ncbi:MAG: hypothetical protein RR198_07900, partial [Oscillospiraceae bacterium]
PPYHPIAYDTALANSEHYKGMFLAEVFCRDIAKKYNIKVYGSYDPKQLGLVGSDFMDELHI